MNGPPEILESIAAILETGLLRIRSLAWSAKSDDCAIEADHIHNLPILITDYSVEKLRYYWCVERLSYIDQIASDQLVGWNPLWEQLKRHAEPLGMVLSSRS